MKDGKFSEPSPPPSESGRVDVPEVLPPHGPPSPPSSAALPKPGEANVPETIPPREPPSSVALTIKGGQSEINHQNAMMKDQKSSKPSPPPSEAGTVEVPEIVSPQGPPSSAAMPSKPPAAKDSLSPIDRSEVIPPQDPPSPPLASGQDHLAGTSPTGRVIGTEFLISAAGTMMAAAAAADMIPSGAGADAANSNNGGPSGEGIGGLSQSRTQAPSGSVEGGNPAQSSQTMAADIGMGYVTAEGVRVVDDSGWQDEFERLEQQFETLRRNQMATTEATEVIREPSSGGQPHGRNGSDRDFRNKVKDCLTDRKVAAALLISVAGVAIAALAGSGIFSERTNDSATGIQIDSTGEVLPKTNPSPQPTRGPFPTASLNSSTITMKTPYPSSSSTHTPTADPAPPPILSSAPNPFSKPTSLPTHIPSPQPTKQPTNGPTTIPPTPPPIPSSAPNPFSKPTLLPTQIPSPQPTKQPTNGPTIPPTPMPTSVPTISTISAVEKRICNDLPSTCPDLSTEGTPQFKALEWLASDSKLAEYEEWRRIQRYVLATVAFSLEGWGTGDVVDWTDGPEDECSWVWGPYEWHKIKCDSLGRVTEIGFDDNLIGQHIPRDVALLSNSLKELWFGSVQLKGKIPSEIGMLTKLERLYLYGNELSGPIPTEVGRLTKLKDLDLYENRLSGQVPSELGNLSQLESLSLWGNDLTGTMPEEVCSLRTSSSKLFSLFADCEEVQCDCCTYCCVDGEGCIYA